jgi:hypothetical protein
VCSSDLVGFERVFRFEEPRAYVESLDDILSAPGPTFVHVRVEPGSEGPIGRTDAEQARYLRSSLFDWSRTLKKALAGGH